MLSKFLRLTFQYIISSVSFNLAVDILILFYFQMSSSYLTYANNSDKLFIDVIILCEYLYNQKKYLLKYINIDAQ